MSQPQSRPFGSVLVANRGEIAIRVLRAARSAGLRTIAVFSDADAGSAHVSEADNAVRIGPTPAAASYLSIPALLRACADSGAEAVHPGYGFLSEQAAFARAVTDAGLVWIGPPPDVIELMGRKDHARDLAVDAGVAVPASYEAGTPRFPVLVKPAAGGGGKGMRIVHDPAELPAALAAARREAIGAFGDDTLLLEQFVPAGRHVEVQVLADVHGAVLHLQPGVHLQEEVLLPGDQELHGAGVDVAHPAGEGDRRVAQPGAHARADRRRRGLLEHLLVAALHRAVPLV